MKEHISVIVFGLLGILVWVLFYIYDWKVAIFVTLVMWSNNYSQAYINEPTTVKQLIKNYVKNNTRKG